MSPATLEAPGVIQASDPDGHYEVVNGRRVETPRMGAYETKLANDLCFWLNAFFVRTKRLGEALIEILLRIDPTRNLQRRPDLAYISYERWPKGKKPAPNDAWSVVPELAVEVVSEGNTANEINNKIHDYFNCGVLLVWIVYPVQEQIYVYKSPTQVQILEKGDTLDGGEVIPGFRLPLESLFDCTA